MTGFSSCEILPCGFSDHYLVKIIFEIPDSLPRGRDVWKFNVSLLQDEDFCSEVESFWAAWGAQENKNDFPDGRVWWDLGKFKLKKIAIKHSVRRSREKTTRKRELKEEFARYNQNTLLDKEHIDDLKSALAEMQAESHVGAQIQSRAQWIKEGERKTKYFFNLEKANKAKITITELTSPSGECLNTNRKILSELRRFYQSIYKAGETDEKAQELFLTKIKKTLSPIEQESLEHELCNSECLEALSSMARNKS